MTLSEFKAWLDGYCESFEPENGVPNGEQWNTIKEKLESVTAINPTHGTYSPSMPREILVGDLYKTVPNGSDWKTT